MMIRIDSGSSTAPFEQIANQLRAGILSGELKEGDHLPTVRQLAYDLEVAPNTIMRAYSILAEEGFLLLKGRKGTLVSGKWAGREKNDEGALNLERLLNQFIRAAESRLRILFQSGCRMAERA